ncbi:Protein SABRE [Vanrija albida]|uniref:Protein SABRE n=1 Tax=Vanrija albida TaxID=181172 RepID=A0ABR3Q1N2_9TREE
MTWFGYLLGVIVVSLILSYIVIPWGLSILSSFKLRATRLSLLSARGLEWRHKSHATANVPTLRIERVYWSRGRGPGPIGLITLNVEGIVVRIRKPPPDNSPPRRKWTIPQSLQQVIHFITHFLLPHWSTLASLVSIRVSGVRIIFEDLQDLEASIGEVRVGVSKDTSGPLPPVSSLQPDAHSEDFPAFPKSASGSAPTKSDGGLHRRSDSIHSRVSKTASKFWTNATKGVERVAFTVVVSEAAILLPNASPSSATQPAAAAPPHSRFPSNGGGGTPLGSGAMGTFESILHPQPWYAKPNDGGYGKILDIDTDSKAVLSAGFGPNRGVLDEDNLRLSIDIGRVGIDLNEATKLRGLKPAPDTEEVAAVPETSAPAHNRWDPQGFPRVGHDASIPTDTQVVLRAFESVTVAAQSVGLSYSLPKAQDVSTGEKVDPDDAHIVSFGLSGFSLALSCTNSGSDPRLGQIYGSSAKENSVVRGINAHIQWRSIGVQYHSSGKPADSIPIVTIKQAQIDLLTTWRPGGWTRELLFSDDLNLAIVIARGCIASVDVAGDIKLFEQVLGAWQQEHLAGGPRHQRPAHRAADPAVLPPRFRLLFEVGSTTVALSNSAAPDEATISLATDGVAIGAHSQFSDVAPAGDGRGTSADRDFSETGSSFTYDTLGETPVDSASSDDVALVKRGEGFLRVQPVTLRISLATQDERQKTYRLATIGAIEGRVQGSVLGSRTTLESGIERWTVTPNTLTLDIETIIDNGIRIELWNASVLRAIDLLVDATKPRGEKPVKEVPKDPKPRFIDRLPSGISLRVSLGNISMFIGHPDLSPEHSSLVRGLWVRTTVKLEYAHYANTAYAKHCKHRLQSSPREQLNLDDDITAEAMAATRGLEKDGGHAALMSVTVLDTTIHTVFNGQAFAAKGGADRPPPFDDWKMPPRPDEASAFVALWGGSKNARMRKEPLQTETDYPPATDLGTRAFVRIPSFLTNCYVHRSSPQAETVVMVRSQVELVHMIGNLSDIYCALMVAKAIHRISTRIKGPAPKSPPPASPTSDATPSPPASPRPNNLDFVLQMPTVWVHLGLPQDFPIFFSMSGVSVVKQQGKLPAVRAGHALLHCLSPQYLGFWDEVGRIKDLEVLLDKGGAIAVNAKGFRIRLPYAFVLASLILSIKTIFKATKLLAENIKLDHFETRLIPDVDGPKKLPTIRIKVELFHVEARDHPVETKINLACRAGLVEQNARLNLEDMFDQKVNLLRGDLTAKSPSGLTTEQTVDVEEAHYRLLWHMSRSWVKRMKRARHEQRRREDSVQDRLKIKIEKKLPIHLLPLEQTAPLLRAAFSGVNLSISAPKENRAELIKYMGDVSSPFSDDVEFTLMIPFNLDLAVDELKISLRDYPLPLLRIQRTHGGPSFKLTTLFVIAEEMSNEDSWIFVPAVVLPAGCGQEDSPALMVDTPKTLLSIKTYARPVIKVNSPSPTFLTWGTSYSPGLSDVQRMFDSLSFAVPDPSPRVGFWDKIRLILHWKVTVDFKGTLRFYLKGSPDPYAINGMAAGFALVWRKNVRIEINQPNDQGELIQITAEECLVTIPDLTSLHDAAAVGNDDAPTDQEAADRALILRRAKKPCARFLNGIRFGIGFRFERTCRPWTCKEDGETDNLLHRQCRAFTFSPHQTVILRTPEAYERMEKEVGHPFDSYEGFRSDFIHFSVSLDAPRDGDKDQKSVDAETHNSLHLTPKAFAHFFAWWRLFGAKTPAPIRQGRVFPQGPPPSKKFGASMGTIKYRCDLAPVYMSHVYDQVSRDLWGIGKAQSLGLKMRVRRFRLDGHQRMQEKREWSELLNRIKTVTHKPFYAADLLLDEMRIKGIVATFSEISEGEETPQTEDPDLNFPKASELPKDLREWYNFFDFIDANRIPFDKNPRMQIVHLGDCSHVFLSRRIKARRTSPFPDEHKAYTDMGYTKFGHEKTHICYLGAAASVGEMQTQLAEERIAELQEILKKSTSPGQDTASAEATREQVRHRISILESSIQKLAVQEHRHMDDNTIVPHDAPPSGTKLLDNESSLTFENTVHVHGPRLFFNNVSRNVLYKYFYSRSDRRREEYSTSNASIRNIRDGVSRRFQRKANGLNQDDMMGTDENFSINEMRQMLENLVTHNADQFRVPINIFTDREAVRRAEQGLPTECTVHPSLRILCLQPQISLRSTADENAVILLAVDEISFKVFSIKDMDGPNQTVTDVLSRNTVDLVGMQAFSPTDSSLERTNGMNRELEFLPREVFVDVRSESSDYERIVLKTDLIATFDRFNTLRVPRGLEWPETLDDYGEPIFHLRKHQNLTSVLIPMITVSATSQHYTALYYIVTDLIMYRDPQAVVRTEKIQNFLYKFDRRDRNLPQVLADLDLTQRHIKALGELQRDYEANVDRLSDEGKRLLFEIRTDVLNETESLFTAIEVINISRDREEAKEALKIDSRIELRAGNIAWHMLRDSGHPLLKLNIKHTMGVIKNNKDASSDNALVIGELQALNSNADSVYQEVIIPYDRQQLVVKKSDVKSNCSVSCSLAFVPSVGGIGIIKEFAFYLYPFRFKLEERVGSLTMDYLFNDRTKKHDDDKDHHKDAHPKKKGELAHDKKQSPNALVTANGRGRSSTILENAPPPGFSTVPDDDAAEMQRRASRNWTFGSIVVGKTFFVLDYKRDDSKKRSGFVWPDVVQFKLMAPEFHYTNKVWGFADIVERVKKDLLHSAWSQRKEIIDQVFTKTSVFRSKKGLRHLAGIDTDASTAAKKGSTKSPLRFTVQPATPLDFDDVHPASVSDTVDESHEHDGNGNGSMEVLEDHHEEAKPKKLGFIAKLRRRGSRSEVAKAGGQDVHAKDSSDDMSLASESSSSRHAVSPQGSMGSLRGGSREASTTSQSTQSTGSGGA